MFGKKILVVNDEPDVLSLVKSRLERSDYDIITAGTGEEGFEKVCTHLPDLILLDVIMPGKTGYQICRELKEKKRGRSIFP
ncbi:MAG: response regulator [Candidatus Omnitrophica bacterium]|nr:response regulator [Candidatus Omnitrophota bacterium]